MNADDILKAMALVKAAMELGPILIRDAKAIIAAGTATQAEKDALLAQIDAMDAARLVSWAEADAALSEAEKH